MAAACRGVKVAGSLLHLVAPLRQLAPRGHGSRGEEMGVGRKGHTFLGLVVRRLGSGGEGQLSEAYVRGVTGWAVWG